MSSVADQMKTEYQAAMARLLKSYHSTPIEKRDYSPSPSARSPREIVLHCALTVEAFTGLLKGQPLPFTDYKQVEPAVRAQEKEVGAAEDAEKWLNERSETYFAWLDQTKESDFQALVKLLGMDMPARVICEILSEHMVCHGAQIDYIQTIYGDRAWHQFE